MRYAHSPHTCYTFSDSTSCAVCGAYVAPLLSDVATPSPVESSTVIESAEKGYAKGPLSIYRMSYPAVTGDMVCQGHADACELYGHATYIMDGVDQGYCPRCYAILSDDTEYTNHDAAYMDAQAEVPAHLFADRFKCSMCGYVLTASERDAHSEYTGHVVFDRSRTR